MSAAIGYLAVLVPVVAIVWIVRAYGRRTAEKETRSRERAAVLMAARQSTGVAPGLPERYRLRSPACRVLLPRRQRPLRVASGS